MRASDTLSQDQLSELCKALPVARGLLAKPTDTEGRYDRALLGLGKGAADASLDSLDAKGLADAISGGARHVAVGDIGVISVMDAPKKGALAGQVAVVTGGAGGLGYSIAEELISEGATVAVLDVAGDAVTDAASRLSAMGLQCDVTDSASVDRAISDVVAAFGGVDILISNAGAAQQGALLDLDDAAFEAAFRLNFWGHHYVARAAVRVMKQQSTGGALVFNVSKQAVNPGPNFAAYGTPKAALMALMRQYAIEHGEDGITSNAVNADRIRTGLMTDQMVLDRSKARGMTPEAYMRGNLIKREVTGKDVAEAFVHLAKARTSTGAVLTVDGGNVAAMLR